METRSLYEIVGVSPKATMEEIREAYLVRSKMFHPDRFDPTCQKGEWHTANEMIKELNRAYKILRDPIARANYDSNLNSPPSFTRHQRSAESPSQNPARIWKVALFSAIIFGGFVALHLIRSEARNSIAGTIRDVVQQSDYVVFYLSKNRPAEGVAVPRYEFRDEIALGMLRGEMRGAIAASLTLGEGYIGEAIEVRGTRIPQSDGSTLIFVTSLRDIHFRDEK